MTDKPHMTLPNGDKLFEGDYGRTRDGRKVGPAVYDYNDEVGFPWSLTIGGDLWYTAEGESNGGVLGDIIAKWTEAPAQPETGTLAELNVKPGDVVEWCEQKSQHTVLGAEKITTGSFAGEIRADLSNWGYGIFGLEQFRIVSRASDTSKPESPKLWRDMTPEEKGALLLAQHEGWVIEAICPEDSMDDWGKCRNAGEFEDCAYRIRPEPKREMVTLFGGAAYDWCFSDEISNYDTYRITFDLNDGKPDLATIRMEAINA